MRTSCCRSKRPEIMNGSPTIRSRDRKQLYNRMRYQDSFIGKSWGVYTCIVRPSHWQSTYFPPFASNIRGIVWGLPLRKRVIARFHRFRPYSERSVLERLLDWPSASCKKAYGHLRLTSVNSPRVLPKWLLSNQCLSPRFCIRLKRPV